MGEGEEKVGAMGAMGEGEEKAGAIGAMPSSPVGGGSDASSRRQDVRRAVARMCVEPSPGGEGRVGVGDSATRRLRISRA